MKKSFKLFVTLFLLAFAVNQSMAQMPTFGLSVRNIHTNPNGAIDSTLDFDIYLQHTNQGASDPFNYAAGQYHMNYNSGIGTGLTVRKTGSDLPASNQCPTFQITVTGRVSAAPNIPVDNGFLISSAFPGTKVLSLRVKTALLLWNLVTPDFAWRSAGTAPFTKVSYFDPTAVVVEIPNTGGQFTVESNDPLPVELASFTANVNRNNVNLTWTTSRETNNAGFDVERKLANATEWTKVGSVNGNGTTTENKTYTFSERANTGNYNYRLKQNDFNGNSEYFALSNEVVVGVPSSYAISQNYPNPFNPTTKIDFDLPYDGKVNIVLFDLSGREIGTLVNEARTAGYYTVQFNASNLASGMYFYRISAEGNGNNFTQTKKMVLIK
jgi:hypothetical protein